MYANDRRGQWTGERPSLSHRQPYRSKSAAAIHHQQRPQQQQFIQYKEDKLILLNQLWLDYH